MSILPSQQALIIACTFTGLGLSTTLKTLSPLTNPNPAHVLCKLLIACRMSPSALNTNAASPSSEYSTFSASMICNNRCTTCASVNFAYLRMAHRDCSGSMILLDWLQAKANRVVFEYISMVLRRACCAPEVILSQVSCAVYVALSSPTYRLRPE